MRRSLGLLTVLAFCLLVLLPASTAEAFTSIKNDWLAQYPDACEDLVAIANDCSLCHGGGFALNAYGSDLFDANLDFASIEGTDSDGDGRTNGEEILNDCSAPGDAVSAETRATWSSIKALF